MVINLSQLSVGYTLSHPVISDINLELRSGQLACLIGENGIGKSTLLKTLTGFLPKLKGSLLLGNRDIESFSQRELARQVSIVLTQKPDVQNLTIEEIIGLGRSPYTGFLGRLRAEDRKVVDDAIATMGIGKLRGRMIQTLSDGERQKVMIAKALAQETPIILLDEPTAFLDFPSKAETFQSLQRMAHERDKLILLSTHDLELAVRFADSLLEVKKGTLQAVSASEVKASIRAIIDS
ncbi:ABC transporter ATP-binding protein [Prevotella melaninogenica]|uniref:ABC transporter ATP-binding protein n=1 Tax=Prevotella melaninogenica TaxID=28132 RepID=UPI001C5D2B7E|nr:ABC transporter ATP-binding protein [Prevotella melaninogenica]MBW4727888.1 ABC transporter ATP-binding protein [Prevotella melaninogenica]MBW4730426.1 ABC transporter ATP-binding protein [Prevotella melaninogenica]MBW4748658.1 ABC transporter ATP-binding protein [Prevotella melaninogenica]